MKREPIAYALPRFSVTRPVTIVTWRASASVMIQL